MINKLKNKIIKNFSNINENINISIYNIYYINSKNTYKYYINYINNIYNNKNLIKLIKKISKKTNSKILHTYKLNYKLKLNKKKKTINITKNILLSYLYNNNNICIYTYIENYSKNKIYTIRTDINIYSCGLISPLNYINNIILFFKSDLININYIINGFTKDINGKKYFINNKISSVKNFIKKKIIKNYDFLEINIYQENLFNIKMIIKNINIKNYIFKNLIKKKYILSKKKKNKIIKSIFKEMYEIYYSKNT